MAQVPAKHLRLVEPPKPDLRVVPDRLCGNCVHVALSQFGAHCMMFHEDVWDERKVAAECEFFES